MAMMRGCIVGFGLVALGTDRITFSHKFIAVRVVAVATHNAGLSHLALHEGPVDVDLIKNLSVVPVERRFECR